MQYDIFHVILLIGKKQPVQKKTKKQTNIKWTINRFLEATTLLVKKRGSQDSMLQCLMHICNSTFLRTLCASVLNNLVLSIIYTV